ncbi:uncharacterized protein LOC106061045 isoform X1 [Biomphalaria glabrata]|uniref:Uncharacterized protein LOC106061045 isoform X1 n=2 Tax=Biomphalaria glabrata TaxID=6526 RepID=A0A9W3A397_BIOGL|nr:uncharacterized protein LOC106061045 isoform X1 [Biomphalaria glabrata]XP_055881682.1 uncharacterized protein LOC106061045 isoform X1 [Biomphalaria glabrata]XP_055881685.1 uncharacterized protein LOC106061045 isoform X1 [Biomphalaria glabrata]KAI8755560.1 flocculation protein FLO11-like [Biomphalaria glabrata]
MAHAVENVVKQGYLKKGSTGSSRISGFFRRNESNKWFVFTIKQGTPYLEYYDNDIDVFSQPPINSFNLSSCQNVKSMGNSNPPSFCIVCPDRVIELIASSRTQMVEWVNEVEASLIRLGILQQEIVDHVYTVCPAVVQKPKPSKDSCDDNFDFSLFSNSHNGKTSEEKRASDTVLIEPTEMRFGISPKASPLAQRSHSWQSTSNTTPHSPKSPSKAGETQPPPLPERAPHQLSKTLGKKSAEPPPSTDLASIFGSSNDSDFVSPEIIAQLREVSKMRRSEERHDLAKDARRHSSNSGLKESSSNRNSLERPTSDTKLIHSQSKAAKDSSSSANEESHSSVFSCSFDNESIFTCHSLDRPVSAEMNDYSELPCQEEARVQVAGGDRVDSRTPSPSSSKPIPMPRRGLTKKLSGDSSSGSSNSSFPLSSSLPEPSTDIITSEIVLQDINDEYPLLIQSIALKDYSEAKTKSLETNSMEKSEKQLDIKSSKDENENFYGPIFDDVPPPYEMAPPVPSLPPLPPRKDSLPLKKSSSDVKVSHLEIKTSSATVTSTTYKQTNLFDDSMCAPPLPMPRKKGPTLMDSYRNSHPPSAFTMNGFHEIPPSVPRRSHPDTVQSLSHAGTNPRLPSRSFQSFIIKRPQLKEFSGMESTTVKSLDDSKDIKVQEHISTNSSSGLSRKMLLDRSHTLHTVVSLKQTQAEILQTEISMVSLTVQLTQKSCHGLALVDWEGKPCIVGWNQKDFPSLHGKLHIGDILISVNNVEVTSLESAQKLLKQPNPSKVDVTLQRMPYAKVFAIRKNTEGQSLGIKREGGTGEIVYVDPNGLAAQHGLTQHANCSIANGRCHWFLTEINSRPLNLFFKDDEIEHRLSALGREITIVVQPYDFIRHIKHQFKKLKNYKSYIVQ